MDARLEKIFGYLVKVAKIIQGFLFLILGIVLPLLIGWNMKIDPLPISENDILEIANYLNISFFKTKYLLENISITLSALFVVGIWKLSVLIEPKRQSMIFQFIYEIAVCLTLLSFILKFTNDLLS